MIANARMYSVAPGAAAAWRELLQWVLRRADVGGDVIDYAPLAPLEGLWDRADLGCVFMCGLPFATRLPQPRLLAAAVPSPARYQERPLYFTDLVVRADAPYARLEETFGARLAYTNESSQSGYSAVRHHLLTYRTLDRVRLYASTLGPLHTPRRVLEAIIEGVADVGPLDSYAHDLLRLHEPNLAARVRTIATTRAAPIPPLVAAADARDDVVESLRAALMSVASDPALSVLRERLLLKGFAPVDASDYGVLKAWCQEADAAGYANLG